jgi:hypothetical protein
MAVTRGTTLTALNRRWKTFQMETGKHYTAVEYCQLIFLTADMLIWAMYCSVWKQFLGADHVGIPSYACHHVSFARFSPLFQNFHHKYKLTPWPLVHK